MPKRRIQATASVADPVAMAGSAFARAGALARRLLRVGLEDDDHAPKPDLRGTGQFAAPLDDATAPLRLGPNNVCDQYGADPTGDLCYTKNLWQWSEELHRRRAIAATLWANLQGLSYPALADAYATTYRVRFQNSSGSAKLFTYINPSRCDPSDVDLGPPPDGEPSALGAIRVLP